MRVGAVMTDVVSRVLLRLEYTPSLVGAPRCPICEGAKPQHEPMCELDESLSTRGFGTAHDRDAARTRLKFTTASTLPPREDLDELEDTK
jgi:hypothetical protein